MKAGLTLFILLLLMTACGPSGAESLERRTNSQQAVLKKINTVIDKNNHYLSKFHKENGDLDVLGLEIMSFTKCNRASTKEFFRNTGQSVLLINIIDLDPTIDQDKARELIHTQLTDEHPEFCLKDEFVVTFYVKDRFDIATTYFGCDE